MSGAHTPLPWAVTKAKPRKVTSNGVLICTAVLRNFATIAQNKHGKGQDEAEANAALIVRAVNSHHALLEALEWALSELRGKTRYDNPQQALNCFDLADAAIARAKGESA